MPSGRAGRALRRPQQLRRHLRPPPGRPGTARPGPALVELKALAESLGLTFFASAWDAPSLRLLTELGVELLKIPSADLVTLPLLRLAGATGLPVVISTGMSRLADIDAAVATLKQTTDRIIILHCNSSYPCPDEQVGLPVMDLLRRRYGLPVGYSGHEQELGPTVASTAFAPVIIERHFTLDRALPGTDHKASLTPDAFAAMAAMVRQAEAAMRVSRKQVFPGEAAAAKLRKPLVYARDLPAGHVLGPEDVACKCPGDGLSPVAYDLVVGGRLLAKVRQDEAVRFDVLALAARSKPDEAAQTAKAISGC
ncbi:MAG: sialic acid synthase [Solidesulfovibrio magneticus str. Maddingley MBC34]|uniref:Sialic acid synthase n=1 Tax=Solidesulfovibrio magneticus str. Maddingley MBC34 TaxID=1206767 RepID=K6GW76_9BACT|nr:MAG: sialic acid synthase [Solidesulfovibrio magneticus str. Maddingley MBC34]